MTKSGAGAVLASRSALAARTRADRQRWRKRLGALSSLRVAPTSERRYAIAYGRLCAFAAAAFWLPLLTLLQLDQCCAAYVEACWEEGEPVNWAGDALAAAQFFMHACRKHLTLSWSLLAAWKRHELPGRALPFTAEVLAGYAGAFIVSGYPRVGAMCVVAFSLILRTAELLELRWDDVAFRNDGGEAIVRLRDTKAGAHQGVFESVVVRDQPTIVALKFLCSGRRAGDQLLQLDERSFRKLWHRVVKKLGMEDMAVRPCSLRRGGATWWFRATLSYDAVADCGRWSNVRTCRRYIEDAAAQLAASRLSMDQEKNLRALGATYRHWSASAKQK